MKEELLKQFTKLKEKPTQQEEVEEIAGETPASEQEPEGFGIEAMKLLVYLEKIKREENNLPPFECYVIDEGMALEFLNQLWLPENAPDNPNDIRRIQAIFRRGYHFTTFDFMISQMKKECVILDAAQAPQLGTLTELFDKWLVYDKRELFYCIPQALTGEKQLQLDYNSCPMFALDHALQISLCPTDVLMDIKMKSSGYGVYQYCDWKDLPPQLVWNAQQIKWIDTYREYFVKKNDPKLLATPIFGQESFEDHIRMGKKNVFPYGDVNASVERLFKEYQKQAVSFIEKTEVEKLQSIINTYPAVTHYKNLPVLSKEEIKFDTSLKKS